MKENDEIQYYSMKMQADRIKEMSYDQKLKLAT